MFEYSSPTELSRQVGREIQDQRLGFDGPCDLQSRLVGFCLAFLAGAAN